MIDIKKLVSSLLIVCILPFTYIYRPSANVIAVDYSTHEPISINDVHATTESPYIIEGYDITNIDGNCIEIHNSEHVIIRNNYLHDCEIDRDGVDYGIDMEDDTNDTSGFAILVGDCEDITIENNRLDYNKQGILLYKTQRINILGNDIRHTIWWRAVALEKCDSAQIAGNSIIDNGIPEWFWAPGKRVLGIFTQQSNSLDIHDNTIIRPSTDGITILGIVYAGSMTSEQNDWTTTAHDIRIYNNTILDVMEIGIALMRCRDAYVYDNVVRQGGIVLDPDVRDSEIYNNKVLTFKIPGAIGMGISHNNYIHDNTLYSIDDALDSIDFVGDLDDLPCQPIKSEWAGIPFQPSSNNRIENNHKVKIGGALAEDIRSKMEIAERDKLWEIKGWFACEIEEGVLDEECVAREKAKGVQGIPAEWMVFEPLMTDFDEYAIVDQPGDIKDDSNKDKEANNEATDKPENTASADEYTKPENPAIDEGKANPDKETTSPSPQQTNEDGTHDLIESIILLLVGAAGGALLVTVINRIRNSRFD